MTSALQQTVDHVLSRVISNSPRVPGVVAMITDRNGNIYEGAAGKRMLGQDADMTTDTVFAIFSTTKAITGTAVLQLVEEGKLDLDAPAENYAPEIGKAAGAGGFRRRRQAEAAGAQARRHHPHAAAAHCRLRLRLLQRAATTAWRRSTASPASSPPRRRRSGRRSCSIPATIGNMAATSTGPARSSKASRGKRLGEVMQERIFAPLGMTSSCLHPLAVDARSPRPHAPARGRRLADAAPRFRAAAGARGPHGRARPLRHGRRLLPLHPHVAQRRCRRARPRAQARDRAHGRDRTASATRRSSCCRASSPPVQRRRVLPRPVEVLGATPS